VGLPPYPHHLPYCQFLNWPLYWNAVAFCRNANLQDKQYVEKSKVVLSYTAKVVIRKT